MLYTTKYWNACCATNVYQYQSLILLQLLLERIVNISIKGWSCVLITVAYVCLDIFHVVSTYMISI